MISGVAWLNVHRPPVRRQAQVTAGAQREGVPRPHILILTDIVVNKFMGTRIIYGLTGHIWSHASYIYICAHARKWALLPVSFRTLLCVGVVLALCPGWVQIIYIGFVPTLYIGVGPVRRIAFVQTLFIKLAFG